jgi:hypothetical protein
MQKATLNLAQTIVGAASIQLQTYNHTEANAALIFKGDARRESFYDISIEQAAVQATAHFGLDVEMAEPVAILLTRDWDATLTWAYEIIADHNEREDLS